MSEGVNLSLSSAAQSSWPLGRSIRRRSHRHRRVDRIRRCAHALGVATMQGISRCHPDRPREARRPSRASGIGAPSALGPGDVLVSRTGQAGCDHERHPTLWTAAAGRLPNLTRGIWKRYPPFGECAGTSPEQPCGDQHCQHNGGKLGHVAGIDAIQYRIDQGTVVVAGIEDLISTATRSAHPI
jgi:hypothetical protein